MRGSRVRIPMMTRDSKKQVMTEFTTELVVGRNDRCIALAIPYEVCTQIHSLESLQDLNSRLAIQTKVQLELQHT